MAPPHHVSSRPKRSAVEGSAVPPRIGLTTGSSLRLPPKTAAPTPLPPITVIQSRRRRIRIYLSDEVSIANNSPGTSERKIANRYNRITVAVFNPNEVSDQQLDWTILRDGGVALYWQLDVLADDLKHLRSAGYRVIEFDADQWKSEELMHDSLKSALSFPEYYGKNLDALNDCMWEDVAVPDQGGLILVLRRYDHFAKAVQVDAPFERSFAKMVLHVFARAVRYHMLFGRRLMIIVQSDDPRIRFDNLAPVFADWNPKEWLAQNRGF